MRVFTSNFFVSVVRNGSAYSIFFNLALTLPSVSLICLLQFSKGSTCTPRYLYVSVLFSISPVIFCSKWESFLSFLLLLNIIYFDLSAFRVRVSLAYLFLTSWRFGQARCLIYFVIHQNWVMMYQNGVISIQMNLIIDSRNNVIYVQ